MGQTQTEVTVYILVLKRYKAFAVIMSDLKFLQGAVYIAQLCVLIRKSL